MKALSDKVTAAMGGRNVGASPVRWMEQLMLIFEVERNRLARNA